MLYNNLVMTVKLLQDYFLRCVMYKVIDRLDALLDMFDDNGDEIC